MKNKEPIFFLQDIQNSVAKIFKYTTNIDYQEFVSNDMIKDAVERNFEIIGEAVKNLSEDFICSFSPCPMWNRIEDAIIEEIGDKYFCRPLKNNFDNRINICVPNELKNQILGEE